MDVEDAHRECGEKLRLHDPHEAGEDDRIAASILQQLDATVLGGPLKLRLPRSAVEVLRGNVVAAGAVEDLRVGDIGEDEPDLGVKLALAGYYDGLLFHRVINGFMIQGGDPLTKDASKISEFGTGGPDYTIPAEIEQGVKAGYRHKKGALAAARIGDAANPYRESSGSQFYIVQDEQACAQLDGAYTVFGETVSGLDVIDKIAAVKTDNRDIPLNPVRINSIKPEASQLKKSAPEEPSENKTDENATK